MATWTNQNPTSSATFTPVSKNSAVFTNGSPSTSAAFTPASKNAAIFTNTTRANALNGAIYGVGVYGRAAYGQGYTDFTTNFTTITKN